MVPYIIYLIVYFTMIEYSFSRSTLQPCSWVVNNVRWRKCWKSLPPSIKTLGRNIDIGIACLTKFYNTLMSDSKDILCTFDPHMWTAGFLFIHLIAYNILLLLTIEAGPLECCCAIVSSILGVTCCALFFCLSRCIFDHFWYGLRDLSTSSYPYLQWIIIDMVCHACDNFNSVSHNIYFVQKVMATAVISSIRFLLSNSPTRLSANSFKAIINTTICISIPMLFNVISLLMDVIILLALQFLLALCGDVHPNPGPCNSKKLKTRKFNFEGKNSPSGSHGASAKMIGDSINILNWNARGLGRVQDQKTQDLLRLMSEKDV
jgi:hypothetical protein